MHQKPFVFNAFGPKPVAKVEQAVRDDVSDPSSQEWKDYVGTILTYSAQKHFGFIQCAELKADAFVSSYQINGFNVGDQVLFNVTFNDYGKPQAQNLRAPEGSFQKPASKRYESRDATWYSSSKWSSSDRWSSSDKWSSSDNHPQLAQEEESQELPFWLRNRGANAETASPDATFDPSSIPPLPPRRDKRSSSDSHPQLAHDEESQEPPFWLRKRGANLETTAADITFDPSSIPPLPPKQDRRSSAAAHPSSAHTEDKEKEAPLIPHRPSKRQIVAQTPRPTSASEARQATAAHEPSSEPPKPSKRKAQPSAGCSDSPQPAQQNPITMDYQPTYKLVEPPPPPQRKVQEPPPLLQRQCKASAPRHTPSKRAQELSPPPQRKIEEPASPPRKSVQQPSSPPHGKVQEPPPAPARPIPRYQTSVREADRHETSTFTDKDNQKHVEKEEHGFASSHRVWGPTSLPGYSRNVDSGAPDLEPQGIDLRAVTAPPAVDVEQKFDTSWRQALRPISSSSSKLPEKAELVKQVKALQRTSSEQGKAWSAYCEEKLGGVKDPQLHSDEALSIFLKMMEQKTPAAASVASRQQLARDGSSEERESSPQDSTDEEPTPPWRQRALVPQPPTHPPPKDAYTDATSSAQTIAISGEKRKTVLGRSCRVSLHPKSKGAAVVSMRSADACKILFAEVLSKSSSSEQSAKREKQEFATLVVRGTDVKISQRLDANTKEEITARDLATLIDDVVSKLSHEDFQKTKRCPAHWKKPVFAKPLKRRQASQEPSAKRRKSDAEEASPHNREDEFAEGRVEELRRRFDELKSDTERSPDNSEDEIAEDEGKKDNEGIAVVSPNVSDDNFCTKEDSEFGAEEFSPDNSEDEIGEDEKKDAEGKPTVVSQKAKDIWSLLEGNAYVKNHVEADVEEHSSGNCEDEIGGENEKEGEDDLSDRADDDKEISAEQALDKQEEDYKWKRDPEKRKGSPFDPDLNMAGMPGPKGEDPSSGSWHFKSQGAKEPKKWKWKFNGGFHHK